MNIIIALIGMVSIFSAYRFILHGDITWIRSHLFILSVKLLLCSITILFFTIYSEKNIWSILIISGTLNIIIFHFLEAHLMQKTLLHERKINV